MHLRLAIACLAAACACACASAPRRPEPEELYQALRLPAAGSGETPELAGRVVLVSFMTTWCFSCIGELPTLSRLQREYGAKGLTVVAVGLDLEGARVLSPFAEHYQLPFPVLIASRALRDGDSPFGVVSSLPTYVLLGRRGEVSAVLRSVAEPAVLERSVRDALGR